MHNQINRPVDRARRRFLEQAGLAAGVLLLPGQALAAPRPHSRFEGVPVGVITYSFRSMPGTAENLLDYLTQLDLQTVELMSDPAEAFAGAPTAPARVRGELSEAQRAEREAYQKEIRNWRLATSMAPFKKLRKMYRREGVAIDIIKFGQIASLSPEEVDYCFRVARTLGARGLTLERTDEAVERLSPYATRHERLVGYHNHAQVNFNSWDKAMELSPYNALNLDVGHYVAGTNESPIPLIEKYHDRILSLHIKDRKKNNGDNVPWGQGDTPLKEILQLMKRRQSKFMATVELEYPIPEGSNAVEEVRKCLAYCEEAIRATP